LPSQPPAPASRLTPKRVDHGTLHVKAQAGGIVDGPYDIAIDTLIQDNRTADVSPGASASATYEFPLPSSGISYVQTYGSWINSGPGSGAEMLAAAKFDPAAPPTPPGAFYLYEYTFTVTNYVQGTIGAYYSRMGAAGSPFGDNPSMQVRTTVKDGSGGFSVGNPSLFYTDFLQTSVLAYAVTTKTLSVYPGQSLPHVEVQSAGRHYPSAAADHISYSTSGNSRINVDSIIAIPYAQLTPPTTIPLVRSRGLTQLRSGAIPLPRPAAPPRRMVPARSRFWARPARLSRFR
jgi:hypothetical protein